MIKIDIGAGRYPAEGFIPLDHTPEHKDTVIVNLEEGVLPFADNSVDAARAIHVLEHIRNLIPLMNEVYRVLTPGSFFKIEVPLANTVGSIKDPTHVRQFIPESFDYFDIADTYEKRPNYGIKKWEVVSMKADLPSAYAVIKVVLRKPEL